VKKTVPLLGQIGQLNPFEIKYRKMFKKTPVATKDLKRGNSIKRDDIEFVKHEKHVVPLAGLNLADKQLRLSLAKGEVFRMTHTHTKVGGIIVARCTSNRLPNKAIRKIMDKETIALLVERIKRCRNLDCVVLATSTDPSDDIIEAIAKREGVLPFRGSLENLSLRFYEAAKYYGIDHIARITGDDILRDEVMLDKAVESHLHESCDVTFTDNMPFGTSTEVFSLNTIKTILETAIVPENTEYLEYYLGNDRYFSANYVKSDYEFDTKWRLTLDYEEDFAFFNKIFQYFYQRNPNFTLQDVLIFLKEHPEVAEINCRKTVKYTKKDLNVKLRI